jgi:hypothetical protein
MPTNRYRGPPMDLANMRAQGARSLSVSCELCRHEAVMNVDRFDDATPAPAFGPRMVCTVCGIIGAFARPNWQERPKSESLTGKQWGQR